MSSKENKLYLIKFIDPGQPFFYKKILTPRAMKMGTYILHKDGKSEERRCVQGL